MVGGEEGEFIYWFNFDDSEPILIACPTKFNQKGVNNITIKFNLYHRNQGGNLSSFGPNFDIEERRLSLAVNIAVS